MIDDIISSRGRHIDDDEFLAMIAEVDQKFVVYEDEPGSFVFSFTDGSDLAWNLTGHPRYAEAMRTAMKSRRAER